METGCVVCVEVNARKLRMSVLFWRKKRKKRYVCFVKRGESEFLEELGRCEREWVIVEELGGGRRWCSF